MCQVISFLYNKIKGYPQRIICNDDLQSPHFKTKLIDPSRYNMYCNAFSRTVQSGLLGVKSTLHVLCNTCSLVRSQCNMNIEIRRLNLVFCLKNVLKQIKWIIWGKQRQGYRSNYVKKDRISPTMIRQQGADTKSIGEIYAKLHHSVHNIQNIEMEK